MVTSVIANYTHAAAADLGIAMRTYLGRYVYPESRASIRIAERDAALFYVIDFIELSHVVNQCDAADFNKWIIQRWAGVKQQIFERRSIHGRMCEVCKVRHRVPAVAVDLPKNPLI